MNKQETIQHLTDLMATISGYYFKGRLEGCRPQVHEHRDDSAAISIDLYNFCGDGKPVCDGLTFCDDKHGEVDLTTYCIVYDPDKERPLWIMIEPSDGSNDFDIYPEQTPEEVLAAMTHWLQAEWESNAHDKHEDKPDPKHLKKLMDRWADFCYSHPPYEDVILWMVGGSKQHYLYQHFCSKFLHLCNVCDDDTMSAWIKFYRELDDQWAERLMEYVYCEWKN